MRHCMQSVGAHSEALQVTEVCPLLHLDTDVGYSSFFEQRRHLQQLGKNDYSLNNTTFNQSIMPPSGLHNAP